jgi:hypothetical protein
MVREIIPQRFENCPIDNLPMRVMVTPQRGINMVNMTGYLQMNEDISGELTGTIEANKCNLDMSNCINYSMLKISDVCGIFSNKLGMFYGVLKTIQPPLKCPLRVGNYTFMDSSIDLSIFSMIPIDGAVS